MPSQTTVVLGHNLTWTITTHDPDTGVLTDADADPTYRLYENEDVPPLMTGTMTALDAVNTTGYYSELIACTTANGFEVGKSYNIYIRAVVDSDPGGIPYGFTVVPELTAAVIWAYATRTLTSFGSLAADTCRCVLRWFSGHLAGAARAMRDGEITILRGDTWDQDFALRIDISLRDKLWFSVKDDKDKTDAAAIIQVEETDGLLAIAGGAPDDPLNGSIVVTDAANGEFTVEIAAVETAKLEDTGKFYYDVQILEGTVVTTLVRDRAVIIGDVTRAVD